MQSSHNIQMKNTQYDVIWIMTLELAIAIILSIFHFFKILKWDRIKFVKLHFLSLKYIPIIYILKVTINVDQGASTFWMHEL